ncbi:hypothetical protein [Salinibacter altiplanensis]|nr:hypothetical protein [Salinibacter altiplanensis]
MAGTLTLVYDTQAEGLGPVPASTDGRFLCGPPGADTPPSGG